MLLVPLLMLLFGVVEYGRAIYQYNTLVKSVRDAARYLSTVSPGATGPIDHQLIAKNLAVCGNTSCSGLAPLVPDLTLGMVKICDRDSIEACPGKDHSAVSTGVSSANLVTVKIVGYNYQPVFTSFTIDLVGGNEVRVGVPTITFDDISNTMRQML